MASHVLPAGVAQRPPRLRAFMGLAAVFALAHRSLWVTDDLMAAAAWQPAGKWRPTPLENLRMLPGVAGSLRLRARVGFRMLQVLEKAHPVEPHCTTKRFGFRVTAELVVPRGGPPLWLMWRTPG